MGAHFGRQGLVIITQNRIQLVRLVLYNRLSLIINPPFQQIQPLLNLFHRLPDPIVRRVAGHLDLILGQAGGLGVELVETLEDVFNLPINLRTYVCGKLRELVVEHIPLEVLDLEKESIV